MSRWKFSEQNCKNVTIRSRFSKQTHKLFTKFPGLATSGRHNSAMITNPRNSLLNGPSTGWPGSILPLQSLQSFIWAIRCAPELTQIFGNVPSLILRIKSNSTLQCWCLPVSDILQNSRLNWKLKISNTANKLPSLSRRNVTLGIVQCRN